MKLGLFASALALASAAPAFAATIDTTGAYTGSIVPFGEPNTATYGQTFTVGSDNVLNSFSLFLSDTPGAPIDFRAYVYAWDGTKATGAALFASTTQSFAGAPAGSPTEFAFGTGSTALLTGSQYVAFLSTSGLQSGGNMTATMPYAGSLGSDALSGGDFVYFNNGNDFGALTTSSWECNGCGLGDAWFKASLSAATGAIPEPSAWALLILGFGAVGGAMRQRRSVAYAAA